MNRSRQAVFALMAKVAVSSVISEQFFTVAKIRGLFLVGFLIISLPAHSQVLMLKCAGKYQTYALKINLTSATFTLFRNGVLDEEEDRGLYSVSREKIVLYSSYGGSEMSVDRINGTFTIIRTTYPCERVADIPRTPKFWAFLFYGWVVNRPGFELTPRSWTNFKGFHGKVQNRVQAQGR